MPLMACVQCYRVWESKKMMLDLIDLENLRLHNRMYILCKECNGKETSVLYDGENFSPLD
jgi:translation initiation factor 2 beta subunit (eIF-2beta)/eIF-5